VRKEREETRDKVIKRRRGKEWNGAFPHSTPEGAQGVTGF